MTNRNPYLSELAFDAEVLALLSDYGIHTMDELARAMLEGRTAAFLSDDQRIDVINEVWTWIRTTVKRTPSGGTV